MGCPIVIKKRWDIITMNKIWRHIKNEIMYLRIWKREIKREKKFKKRQKEYIKRWYKKQTGKKLNLEKPETFTEKIQWIKIYGITKLKVLCSDKYKVRAYVSKTIGDKYLVPIIRIGEKELFKNPYEIKYNQLPNSFVIQCNHGSHMTHIIKNKSQMSIKSFKRIQKQISKELKIEYAYCHGYEMQYEGIEPYVFVTKYLNDNDDLPDYKLFYFHGEFLFLFVDQNRFTNHKRTVFDINLNVSEYQFDMYNPIKLSLDKDVKEKIKEMIKLGEELAKPFDHVRVDFYLCDNRIYFGEMTFTTASGKKIMKPESSDLIIGGYL